MGKTNYSIALQEDSKNFITEATLQLLDTKSLTKLTVMEVVKRAGVSRMAFYRNFESIEDVLKQYYTPKFEHFFDEVKKKTHQEDIEMLLAFFTLMKKDLIKAIDHDYDRIFFDILTKQTEEFLRPKNELESFEMTYMIAGTFAVWKSWLSQENTTTLEDMSILLTRLTKNLPGTM